MVFSTSEPADLILRMFTPDNSRPGEDTPLHRSLSPTKVATSATVMRCLRVVHSRWLLKLLSIPLHEAEKRFISLVSSWAAHVIVARGLRRGAEVLSIFVRRLQWSNSGLCCHGRSEYPQLHSGLYSLPYTASSPWHTRCCRSLQFIVLKMGILLYSLHLQWQRGQ